MSENRSSKTRATLAYLHVWISRENSFTHDITSINGVSCGIGEWAEMDARTKFSNCPVAVCEIRKKN